MCVLIVACVYGFALKNLYVFYMSFVSAYGFEHELCLDLKLDMMVMMKYCPRHSKEKERRA